MRKKEMVKKIEELSSKVNSLENKYYNLCAAYQIYVPYYTPGFALSKVVEIKDVVSEIIEYLGLDIRPENEVPKKVKLIKREVKGEKL